MAKSKNSSIIIIIIGVVALIFLWQAGYLEKLGLGSVYEGGPTQPVSPSCVLTTTTSVNDQFICDSDKCLVDVIYPTSALTDHILLNQNLADTGSATVSYDTSPSPYMNCIYTAGTVTLRACGLNGSTVIPASEINSDYTKMATATKNLIIGQECDVSKNCVFSYYGVPSQKVTITAPCDLNIVNTYSPTRVDCKFNMLIKNKAISKMVIITDKGITKSVALSGETSNINDASILEDLRSLKTIYISNGGLVSAPGAVLNVKKYTQCVDCETGTGVCLVNSVECVNQTSYKNCFDAGNNCGVYSQPQPTTDGLQCVNNNLICNNECPAEGYAATEAGGTQYKICLKSPSNCLYWSPLSTCPSGVLYDVNTKSCSICLGSEVCLGREPGAKWLLNATTYAYCEVEGICKVQKTASCPTGLIYNSNFVCVDPNQCVLNTLQCSADSKAVLKCTADGSWVTNTACSGSTVCNPNTKTCVEAYTLSVSTATTNYIDAPIGVGVQLTSSVQNFKNVPVTVNLKTGTGSLINSMSGNTDNYGYVTINLDPPTTTGTYVVEVISQGYTQTKSILVSTRPVCTNNLISCSDDFNSIMKCVSGAWQIQTVCPSGQKCDSSTNTCQNVYSLNINTASTYYTDAPVGVTVQLTSASQSYANKPVNVSLQTTTSNILTSQIVVTDSYGQATANLQQPATAGNYVVAAASQGYTMTKNIAISTRNACTSGAVGCSGDFSSVLQCTNNQWVVKEVCTDGDKCDATTNTCTQVYSVAVLGDNAYSVGESVAFNVQVSSSITNNKNIPLTATVENEGVIVQTQTRNTDEFGMANFNLAPITAPGKYTLKVDGTGISQVSYFNITNQFKLEYYDTPVLQYASSPMTIGIRILDVNNAPVTSTHVSIIADIDGLALNQPTIVEENVNEFRLTWLDSYAGLATVKFVLSKPNYETKTFEKTVNIAPTGISLSYDAAGKKSDTQVEYTSPGTNEWTIYTKSISTNSLEDADNVSIIIKNVPTMASKVATGTYKVSYNFQDSFYDVTIKAVKDNKAVTRRVSVNVFGGVGGGTTTGTGTTTTTTGGTPWSTGTSSGTTFDNQPTSSPATGSKVPLITTIAIVVVGIVAGMFFLGRKKR